MNLTKSEPTVERSKITTGTFAVWVCISLLMLLISCAVGVKVIDVIRAYGRAEVVRQSWVDFASRDRLYSQVETISKIGGGLVAGCIASAISGLYFRQTIYPKRLLISWLLLNIAGMVTATLLVTTLFDNWRAFSERSLLLSYLLGFIGFAVLGAIIGVSQWLVLRRHNTQVRWWIVAVSCSAIILDAFIFIFGLLFAFED